MNFGPWNDCSQSLKKFEASHRDGRGAVIVGFFENVDDLALGAEAQPVECHGRACDVSAKLFDFVPFSTSHRNTGMETEA